MAAGLPEADQPQGYAMAIMLGELATWRALRDAHPPGRGIHGTGFATALAVKQSDPVAGRTLATIRGKHVGTTRPSSRVPRDRFYPSGTACGC
jgi:hypothetical protein